jgi:hypothetical protein
MRDVEHGLPLLLRRVTSRSETHVLWQEYQRNVRAVVVG